MGAHYEWEESVSAFPRNGMFVFAMFCSGCHSQLANAAKFCRVCGITISVKDEDLFCVAQLEVKSSERNDIRPLPSALRNIEKGKERKGTNLQVCY